MYFFESYGREHNQQEDYLWEACSWCAGGVRSLWWCYSNVLVIGTSTSHVDGSYTAIGNSTSCAASSSTVVDSASPIGYSGLLSFLMMKLAFLEFTAEKAKTVPLSIDFWN